MTMSPVAHIVVDDGGVARVAGTRIKVSQLAIDASTWGKSPTEIQEDHPRLTLGQIYAALGYYFDHKAQIDAQIDDDERFADEAKAAAPNPLSRADFEARLLSRLPD
jgi:uncharacterized protein (DUF433 family)